MFVQISFILTSHFRIALATGTFPVNLCHANLDVFNVLTLHLDTEGAVLQSSFIMPSVDTETTRNHP
jgi:hypothetical protein